MRYETAVTTSAGPDRVWARLTDVERWPEWISVYRSVQRLDQGPLQIGSKARIDQIGVRPATWEVTDLVPGRSFVWQCAQPGVRTVGGHVLGAEPGGGTRIALRLEQHGALAGVVAALLGRRIRRYVDLEAAGLKAASEDDSAPDG